MTNNTIIATKKPKFSGNKKETKGFITKNHQRIPLSSNEVKVDKVKRKDLHHYAKIMESELGFNKEEALAYVKQKPHVLKANFKNKPVGFLSYIKEDKNILYIDDFDVISEYRSKGIGSSLLKNLENYAKLHGYKTIKLHVAESNPKALKFYEKNNFNDKTLIPKFFNDKFPAYCLMKHFSKK